MSEYLLDNADFADLIRIKIPPIRGDYFNNDNFIIFGLYSFRINAISMRAFACHAVIGVVSE